MVSAFVEPLRKAIAFVLDLSHPVSELFALLTTLLKFGVKFSMCAFLYTNVHLDFVRLLEVDIGRICGLLAQNLTASVVQWGRLADHDAEQIAGLRAEARHFLAVGRELGVPDPVIEALIIECCRLTDAMLFNALIVSDEIFTIKGARELAKKIRAVQEIFQCMSQNFRMAFDALLNLIGIVELYLGGVEVNRIGEPSPLVRDVVDRCRPVVVLPANVSWRAIGPKPTNRDQLRVEHTEFKFEFQWLLDAIGPPWQAV
jgi:hypothetical protein